MRRGYHYDITRPELPEDDPNHSRSMVVPDLRLLANLLSLELQWNSVYRPKVRGPVVMITSVSRRSDLASAGVRARAIECAIAEVERTLSGDILYIRYEIGSNWLDQPAVFFRVVLSDEAGHLRLVKVMEKFETAMRLRLDFGLLGLHPYYACRSLAEQKELRDEEWEPLKAKKARKATLRRRRSAPRKHQ